jgi:hypothetical protein
MRKALIVNGIGISTGKAAGSSAGSRQGFTVIGL